MDPSSFETSHVHSIYNEIASDFSRTRHSRWPFVEAFLKSLPTGSLVLDAGTGNGKYLGVRSLLEWHGKQEDAERTRKGKEPEEIATETLDNSLFHVGYDMSDGLLGIASGKGHEVVRGDCVDMSCWRRGAFVSRRILLLTFRQF
jgi:tRNA (uracil-5-)-methyltransferase TRM9